MPLAGVVLSQQLGRSRGQLLLLPLRLFHIVILPPLPLRKMKALRVAA